MFEVTLTVDLCMPLATVLRTTNVPISDFVHCLFKINCFKRITAFRRTAAPLSSGRKGAHTVLDAADRAV